MTNPRSSPSPTDSPSPVPPASADPSPATTSYPSERQRQPSPEQRVAVIRTPAVPTIAQTIVRGVAPLAGPSRVQHLPSTLSPIRPIPTPFTVRPASQKRRRSPSLSPIQPVASTSVMPQSTTTEETSDDGEYSIGSQHFEFGQPLGEAQPKKKRTRTLTTPYQSQVLHDLLARSRFPSTAVREEVGRSIGMSARKVQVWFQNQRQKARRQQQESAETEARQSQHGSHAAEPTIYRHSMQGVRRDPVHEVHQVELGPRQTRSPAFNLDRPQLSGMPTSYLEQPLPHLPTGSHPALSIPPEHGIARPSHRELYSVASRTPSTQPYPLIPESSRRIISPERQLPPLRFDEPQAASGRPRSPLTPLATSRTYPSLSPMGSGPSTGSPYEVSRPSSQLPPYELRPPSREGITPPLHFGEGDGVRLPPVAALQSNSEWTPAPLGRPQLTLPPLTIPENRAQTPGGATTTRFDPVRAAEQSQQPPHRGRGR